MKKRLNDKILIRKWQNPQKRLLRNGTIQNIKGYYSIFWVNKEHYKRLVKKSA